MAAPVCPMCGRPTHPVPPEDRHYPDPVPAPGIRPGVGDLIGRAIFGGFWTVAALAALVTRRPAGDRPRCRFRPQ